MSELEVQEPGFQFNFHRFPDSPFYLLFALGIHKTSRTSSYKMGPPSLSPMFQDLGIWENIK